MPVNGRNDGLSYFVRHATWAFATALLARPETLFTITEVSANTKCFSCASEHHCAHIVVCVSSTHGQRQLVTQLWSPCVHCLRTVQSDSGNAVGYLIQNSFKIHVTSVLTEPYPIPFSSSELWPRCTRPRFLDSMVDESRY